jgi:hypothetical protein
MQKTFLWLICVSSMAGVFAQILAVFDAIMFSNEIDLLEIHLQVFLQFFFN